jgi:hypothetical protein
MLPRLGDYTRKIAIKCPSCQAVHHVPCDMRDGDITYNVSYLKCNGCGRGIVKDEIEKQVKAQTKDA